MRNDNTIVKAVAIAAGIACLVGSADASHRRHGHRWHHNHHNYGGAALFGLAAGLIVGGALAPGYGYGPGYYGYAPRYYDPYRPRYYAAPPAYYGGPWDNAAGCCYYGPYGYDPAYRLNR